MPPISAGRLRRRDIYSSMRAAVLDGVLRPLDHLPSTRQAAADYGVSRGMMEEVYDQLVEEGFLERSVGRGTFVAGGVAALGGSAPEKRGSPRASRRGLAIAKNARCREPEVLRPFNAAIADTSEFPWQLWRRLQGRAMRELGQSAFTFADPRGLPNLSAAIARYMAQFRGIRCDPRQVMIFNSAQQALNALAVLLLDRGDAVWIEDPCYPGARAVFDLAGAKITAVPVDGEGIHVELGIRRSPRARLAYVTPPHQYPTGAALSLERRVALLEWATRNDSWVIEDDYDGEFRYAGQPLAALYSLDSNARVLYLGTLNKAMFVSLRLAYLVAPEEIVEPLANIRTQLDGFTPPVTQMAMSMFMEEGYFASHLRRMRSVYGAKRAALVETLTPLKECGWTWPDNPAGIHLLIRHNDGDHVRAVARASSLDLALLSSYRTSPAKDDGLFLRFGALDTASLREGAASLVADARKCSR